jgi:hypothetical protein
MSTDGYESTMTCLTRIAPLLSQGGRLVIDDYDEVRQQGEMDG